MNNTTSRIPAHRPAFPHSGIHALTRFLSPLLLLAAATTVAMPAQDSVVTAAYQGVQAEPLFGSVTILRSREADGPESFEVDVSAPAGKTITVTVPTVPATVYELTEDEVGEYEYYVNALDNTLSNLDTQYPQGNYVLRLYSDAGKTTLEETLGVSFGDGDGDPLPFPEVYPAITQPVPFDWQIHAVPEQTYTWQAYGGTAGTATHMSLEITGTGEADEDVAGYDAEIAGSCSFTPPPVPAGTYDVELCFLFRQSWQTAGGTLIECANERYSRYALTVQNAGGYLSDPSGDATLTTVGAYDGYLYASGAFGVEEATAVRGTLSLKVTGLAGNLTAKAVLQGGSVSFKGATWGSGTEPDGTRRAELKAAGGETLDLFVRQNRIWGTLSGGKAGATPLSLDGARNRFAERGDTGAAALLEAFKGYYTVALPATAAGAISASAEVDAAPQGAGYLTVTVGSKGSAKIAGVLADGTQVTAASRLILFDGSGLAACVPLFAPLYAKKGWVGGLLWIDPATRTVETDRDIGWFIRWENPGRSGPDGFSLLLDACGGFYGTGVSLASAYLFGAETEGTAFYDAMGEPWEWAAVPEAVPVSAAGGRMTVAKATKPKKFSEEGEVWYEYDETNPANVTLSFASRTGLFKGKFSLYCDFEDASGRMVHKAVSVPYAGVLTPVRGAGFDGLPAGLGHCLVPDNAPAVKAYRLKRSRPVWLEAE